MEGLKIFCVLILFAVHSFCIPIETHRSGRLPSSLSFLKTKAIDCLLFFRTDSVPRHWVTLI